MPPLAGRIQVSCSNKLPDCVLESALGSVRQKLCPKGVTECTALYQLLHPALKFISESFAWQGRDVIHRNAGRAGFRFVRECVRCYTPKYMHSLTCVRHHFYRLSKASAMARYGICQLPSCLVVSPSFSVSATPFESLWHGVTSSSRRRLILSG